MTPSTPSMLPIMSLFRTASMFQPSSTATSAMIRPPKRPCSSPESPARTIVAANEPAWRLSTRAASIAPAIPEALSFAPGESLVKSPMSETRLSMSPDMIT